MWANRRSIECGITSDSQEERERICNAFYDVRVPVQSVLRTKKRQRSEGERETEEPRGAIIVSYDSRRKESAFSSTPSDGNPAG